MDETEAQDKICRGCIDPLQAKDIRKNSELSLIHETAREFLIAPPEKPTVKWMGSFNKPGAHSTIPRGCLDYLMLLPTQTQGSSIDNPEYPLTTYAANFFPFRFILQETGDADKYQGDAHTLCSVPGPWASIWASVYFRQRNLRWESWTDLALASYLSI